MLKEKIENALNEQINAELFSAYLYYSMAAYFQNMNLCGFSNWLHVQAMEELTHVDKFYKFILDRGGKVIMQAIECPKTEWSSPAEAVAETLKHEEYITDRINNLVDLALQEKDFATKTFLDWFVTEQVEEVASVEKIFQDVKMVLKSEGGLFMLDRELQQRTFVMPVSGA